MKILDDIEVKVGRWAIAAVAIALVLLLLVMYFVWHRRQPVAPIPPVTDISAGVAPRTPTPPPTAAVAQAAVTTSTHVHITIRRWPKKWPAAVSQRREPAQGNGDSSTSGTGAVSSAGSDSGSAPSSATPDAIATDSPPIEIDVTTTSTATSSAAATASAPIAAVPIQPSMIPSHGRIGVFAATVPGVLAVDVEAIQLRTPWWLVGQPIEVGLDAEANLAEAGAGISVGSKAFAEAGGYVGYDLRQRGLYVGGGLRF